jgi:polar amino acid transport system permease protein
MDLSLILRTYPFFMEAAWVTVQISLLSLLLGLGLAIILVAGRLSPVIILRWAAKIYVSVFRGTPCLVQLFIIYFGGPQIGIELEPFSAAVIGLGMNIAAYMSESIEGLSITSTRPGGGRTVNWFQPQADAVVHHHSTSTETHDQAAWRQCHWPDKGLCPGVGHFGC